MPTKPSIQTIESQCEKAFNASKSLLSLTTQLKNKVLLNMANALENNKTTILNANKEDVEKGKKNGLSKALTDRLSLNEERIISSAKDIRQIAQLTDPIGEVLEKWTQPIGITISKIRVPLGVIGMIYEARPNVTIDAITLGLKTSNAVVLRGSSSAYNTNRAITDILRDAAQKSGLDPEIFQLLEDTSREGVPQFVKLNKYLSLIIPRGGAGLIQNVINTATVPTIETGVGNCHVYVDKDADLEKAEAIAINAKIHRPSVCNAAETLLVHADIANVFLPKVLKKLSEEGVEIRADEKTLELFPDSKKATETDWDTEYLDLILAVKVVKDLDDAINHIQKHGTLHSEAIISENKEAIFKFCQTVDASTVLVNASTRLTDGGVFGFGAEIGISTQKLHARGPMGLKELTSYKYIVEGDGIIRH